MCRLLPPAQRQTFTCMRMSGPDENMPHVDATVEAPDQAEEPAQQADVDDDMDEDEEVI